MSQDEHNVLIVEDDPVIRKFLHLAIAQTPQLRVVDTACSVESGSEALRKHNPTILVVDLTLPDGSGIDLIHKAKHMTQPIECMVVTMHDDQEHLFQALRAGATGYLLKDALPDNIGLAILDLLEGGAPISPTIARALLHHFGPNGGQNVPPPPPITDRELDVLQMMARGMLRREIASHLHLSLNTINTHIRNIYRKLGVSNNVAAIYQARRLNILAE